MDNLNLNSNVLTIAELCELLHISRKYAYKFIRDNNIKFMQIGRKFYLSRKAVEKLLSMED
ncbi:MAG: helix-turn-helix domain-containing protein [Clostridiales bacterium]|nr:helix-turn-helix domain-containing protein [Clostridiales bacterium]